MGGKSIVSTIRHGKFGNVDVKLGVSMIVGTTVGMELGARLVMYLEQLGLAESVIRKIYVLFLFLIGSYVLYDYIPRPPRRPPPGNPPEERDPRAAHAADAHPPMIHARPPGSPAALAADPGFTTGSWRPSSAGGGSSDAGAHLPIGCPTLVAVGTDLFEVMVTGLTAFTYGVRGRVELLAAMDAGGAARERRWAPWP
jgi:uncharacterized membrane protein YfcA